MKYLAPLVLIALLTGCAPTETWTIAAHKVPCTGLFPTLCVAYTTADGESHVLYEGIQGFDFEWGVHATVEITEEHLANPPADGSSIVYHLVQVIEETPATDGEQFELDLDNEDLSSTGAGTLNLHDVTVAVPDPAVLATILDALAADERVNVVFEYGEDTVLVAVGTN